MPSIQYSGGTIADHVSGRVDTRYISASETAAAKKYASGNGMAVIDARKVGGWVPHKNVLTEIKRGGGTLRDVQNAVNAKEVLVKDTIPRDAVTEIVD